MNQIKTETATSDAVANRATTRDARAIRRAVQNGLEGTALDFARAIDFDKLAAAWGHLGGALTYNAPLTARNIVVK